MGGSFLTLVDARQGRNLTGIGQYAYNLLDSIADAAPDAVRPICWAGQRATFAQMGLRPWTPVGTSPVWLRFLPSCDVIHGLDFEALEHRSARCVVTIHDLAYRRGPDWYPPGVSDELHHRVQRASQRAALLLCDSHCTRVDLLENYEVDEERTRVIHLGVSSRFFDVDATEAEASTLRAFDVRRPYLLHVGALVPRKDVPTLLGAFREIHRRGIQVDLVLAGDTARGWLSDHPKIASWLESHPDIAGAVHILDHVGEEHVPALFAAARAYVTSSRWEGFGLSVLQAMASRTPVVASDAGSLPEVGGDTVWYARPGDIAGFADGIELALADTPEVSARVEAARQRAAGFTWQQTAKQTLAAYADARR